MFITFKGHYVKIPSLWTDGFSLCQTCEWSTGFKTATFTTSGFIIGVISAAMVVTRSDRRDRSKLVQPGNLQQLSVQMQLGGAFRHFWSFKEHTILVYWRRPPANWTFRPTPNRWTNNKCVLERIKHFDKHTRGRRKGVYRTVLLDGHESHSIEFKTFCEENNIITVCLPAHLTQPFDFGCFNVLRAYNCEVEHFIKLHINQITNVEWLLAFNAAHFAAMTKDNIKEGVREAGLVPCNPEAVISQLYGKLSTPTPTVPPRPTLSMLKNCIYRHTNFLFSMLLATSQRVWQQLRTRSLFWQLRTAPKGQWGTS